MPRQNTSKSPTIIKQNKIPINPSPNVIVKNNNSTSLLGSIKEGFGFGIGSTIARNLFGSTPVYPSNLESKPNSASMGCIEYNKCLEANDKYECFGNLDQKEYVECRTKYEK
jgi:hypothetical protein